MDQKLYFEEEYLEGYNDIHNEFGESTIVKNYRTDLDWMFDEESFTKVEECLKDSGFSALIPIFKMEKIDMEAFMLLDRTGIYKILDAYAMGIRLKFFNFFENWKQSFESLNINRNESANSLRSVNSSQCLLDSVSFKNFIENTQQGQNFAQKHPRHEIIPMDSKRELCQILCTYFYSIDVVLGVREIKQLSESIEEYFTAEKASIYMGTKEKRGLLHNKVINFKSKLVEKGFIKPPPNKKMKKENPALKPSLAITNEEQNSDVFVRTHPFSNGPDFENHWKKSLNIRVNNIKSSNASLIDILNKYKTYTRSDGFYFVLMDFDALHPNNFSEKWNNLISALLPVMKRETKNIEIKTLLNKYESINDSSKTLVILYALHAFLFSGYGIKKQHRESIKESFEKLILIVENEGMINRKLEEIKLEYAKRKCWFQPIIICSGSGLENVEENFIIYFESHMYKIREIEKAIEICLKMYMFYELNFIPTLKTLMEFLTFELFAYPYELDSKSKALQCFISSA